MKLISVIVPIYKVEKYLRLCLESIVNQTYKNLEIILVDDGSPDNCGVICDEYAKNDDRIKVIHKENGGLSSARNAGLDIASGEYLSFIDSDDYVANDFIEKLYKLSVENDADIVECDFLKFEGKAETNYVKEKIEKMNSLDILKKMYSKDATKEIVVWNKLYKRNIYEDLRFPVGRINEDEFTTYKAVYKTKKLIIITNLPLYYYRCNNESIMGKKFNLKRLDLLDALEERKNFYKENVSIELYELTVRAYQKYINDYYFLVKKNIKNAGEYLRNIRNKSKKNIKEYLKLNSVGLKRKIKILFIFIVPCLYNLESIKKTY